MPKVKRDREQTDRKIPSSISSTSSEKKEAVSQIRVYKDQTVIVDNLPATVEECTPNEDGKVRIQISKWIPLDQIQWIKSERAKRKVKRPEYLATFGSPKGKKSSAKKKSDSSGGKHDSVVQDVTYYDSRKGIFTKIVNKCVASACKQKRQRQNKAEDQTVNADNQTTTIKECAPTEDGKVLIQISKWIPLDQIQWINSERAKRKVNRPEFLAEEAFKSPNGKKSSVKKKSYISGGKLDSVVQDITYYNYRKGIFTKLAKECVASACKRKRQSKVNANGKANTPTKKTKPNKTTPAKKNAQLIMRDIQEIDEDAAAMDTEKCGDCETELQEGQNNRCCDRCWRYFCIKCRNGSDEDWHAWICQDCQDLKSNLLRLNESTNRYMEKTNKRVSL